MLILQDPALAGHAQMRLPLLQLPEDLVDTTVGLRPQTRYWTPARGPRIRGLRDVRRFVPDPYLTSIVQAYGALQSFARRWWRPLDVVVRAEPFAEWLQHAGPAAVRRYYRDHLAHQMRVAAIGDMLLDQVASGATVLDHAVVAYQCDLASVTAHPHEFVRLAWWLCALFHDCGYGHQYAEGYSQVLRWTYSLSMPPHPPDMPWVRHHQCLANLLGGLSSADLQRFAVGHHCFFGACELAVEEQEYANRVPNEDPQIRSRRKCLFRLAARAVLNHDCAAGPPGTPPRLSSVVDPLSYLLVLSDELHEADRPRVRLSKSRRPPLRTFVTYEPSDVDSASVDFTPVAGGGTRLDIEFRRRPGATLVQGNAPATWAVGKEDLLRRRLEFGVQELFHAVQVSCP